jgi:hypothetical protein
VTCRTFAGGRYVRLGDPSQGPTAAGPACGRSAPCRPGRSRRWRSR